MKAARIMLVVLLGIVLSGIVLSNAISCATNSEPTLRTLTVDDEMRAAESSDRLLIRARYNPCQCSAPDFEIHVHGGWQRHILIAGEDALLAVMREEVESAQDRGMLRFLRLEGEWNGMERLETGIQYPVFAVEAFEVEVFDVE